MEHALPLATNASRPLPAQVAWRDCAGQALAWTAFDRSDGICAWQALAQSVAEPNPFHDHWYLLPALRAFDPAAKVRLFTLAGPEGTLDGLLPICREPDYYGYRLPHWRNWVHANCFLGLPLVRRGRERAFWRALLDWADAHCGLALFLHLIHQPLSGPLHDALKTELHARPAATVLCEERAMLRSDMSPEAYLEGSLTGKKRKELRRQERRLGEEGALTFERCEDTLGVAQWAAEFLALEAGGWKGNAGSAMGSDPRTAALFKAALAGAASHGQLERLALRLDGRAIAMLANFIAPPAAFSFKTAFDEDYARFSPGVLLQCENLALLERRNVAFADSCAAPDHPMIDHLWRERRAIARHSIAIGGALRRALFQQLSRRETGNAAQGIL